MLTDDEIDLCRLAYSTMTPAEREAFKRKVIRRAYAARDAVMRATILRLWRMPPNVRGVAQACVAGLRSVWTFYRKARNRRVAVRELLSLNDHMLKDMGLSRSEVIAVVYGEDDSRLPPGMTSRKGGDKVDACISRSSVRAPQVSTLPI